MPAYGSFFLLPTYASNSSQSKILITKIFNVVPSYPLNIYIEENLVQYKIERLYDWLTDDTRITPYYVRERGGSAVTSEGEVLAEAVSNASIILGITSEELNNILGNASPQSLHYIEPTSHTANLASQFIRCYKSLYWHVGGKTEEMHHWLRSPNRYFDNRAPLELMQTPEGLYSVMIYLEGMMSKR